MDGYASNMKAYNFFVQNNNFKKTFSKYTVLHALVQ